MRKALSRLRSKAAPHGAGKKGGEHMQHLPDHPASAEEYAHLQATCDVIDEEITKLEKDTGVGVTEDRQVVVPQNASMDEQVALDIFRMKLDTLHQLGLASHQAYFARLDFIPTGGTKETHYLGRWGVMTSSGLDTVVVDWRSPVANLYYSGQIGPMSYAAPDGTVEGEMTLKRMLTVRDRELKGLFDSGVVSQDEYLQSVLGQVSSDKLREIVTTIQAEQNLVIRHPMQVPLIVQGVAGSGKTTIALHRIAWLLYAHRKTLRPEQLMILAPNPLFLDYISQVLPDLGVERVMQTTFPGLCRTLLGKRLPKVTVMTRLEDKLNSTRQERERVGAVLRRKGSLAFKASLEGFLASWQQELLPQEGWTFGNVVLLTREELASIFLRQLSPFPIQGRMDEMKKYLRRRLKDASERMKQQLDKLAQNRLDELLRRLPDGPERRQRATRLLESRDARMREVDERAAAYLKNYKELWPDISLTTVYATYLTRCEGEDVQAATLPLLEKGTVQMEDLPAMVTLGKFLYGVKQLPIRHVVVDECQDFSPYQVQLLRELTAGASFTLVGDLMQGVHEEEGIHSFNEWLDPVFHGEAQVKQLVTSYRNTVEIMNLASQVAARHPVEGQLVAKPVLRHGEAPRRYTCTEEKARIAKLADLAQGWVQDGYHTIAIIEKTRAQAEKTWRALKKLVPVRLLQEGDATYGGGILVLPAALAKGLEFDCVIVGNCNAEQYPEDAFLSRVLYVMLTRPLHHLALVHTGTLSPLLAGVEGMTEG